MDLEFVVPAVRQKNAGANSKQEGMVRCEESPENFETQTLFAIACQDVARIVSILSIESDDILRPWNKNDIFDNFYNKATFFFRFLYLVFYKGFTPIVFDMLPFYIWLPLSLAIYIYRLTILPIWLRIIGYGRFASWSDPPLGQSQPELLRDSSTLAAECRPYTLPQQSLSKEGRLAALSVSLCFGDVHFERFVEVLYLKRTHLSPHSQSPGHPFVSGYPGNFMDHLLGVYKILVAWGQPMYVVRAGMFHSAYGTFDYRAGFWDLRLGRRELISLLGPAAEEIVFLVCTSDRIGLMRDLAVSMYGQEALKRHHRRQSVLNATPLRRGAVLTELGFGLRNHITQCTHIIPPDLFAQFCVVMIADFIEQGALSPLAPGSGGDDLDVCLFQFLRFRFYRDVMLFVRPYLRVKPATWDKYFPPPTSSDSAVPVSSLKNGTVVQVTSLIACSVEDDFDEPSRSEVIAILSIWTRSVHPAAILCEKMHHHRHPQTRDDEENNNRHYHLWGQLVRLANNISLDEKTVLLNAAYKYPYLAEPRIALAFAQLAEVPQQQQAGTRGVNEGGGRSFELKQRQGRGDDIDVASSVPEGAKKLARSQRDLLQSATSILQDWGMMAIKKTTLKQALCLINWLGQEPRD